MPLFEYECRACGHRFEYLTRQGLAPSCPACRSAELDKRLSVFAVGAGGRASAFDAPAPCGTCGDPRGPGACSLDN